MLPLQMESECFVDQSESKEKDPETGKTDGAKSDAGSESEVS